MLLFVFFLHAVEAFFSRRKLSFKKQETAASGNGVVVCGEELVNRNDPSWLDQPFHYENFILNACNVD